MGRLREIQGLCEGERGDTREIVAFTKHGECRIPEVIAKIACEEPDQEFSKDRGLP